MRSAPAGWFLILAGLWLARTCFQATDTRWSRLTMNWPVPWPLMADATKRGIRVAGGLVGTLLAFAGAAILLTV
jgi:hypothetical protein